MKMTFTLPFTILWLSIVSISTTNAQEQSANLQQDSDEATTQEDQVFSGPQAGEKIAPIELLRAFSEKPNEKYELKFEGEQTHVLIFIHQRTRLAFGLTRAVMQMIDDHSKQATGTICVLTQDPPETREWLNRIKNYFPKTTNVAISPDGVEGPGALGLNREVMLTILVTKKGKVDANFALKQPSLNVDGQKIADAISSSAGIKPAPRIAKYSPRNRNQRNMRGGATKANETLRPYLRPVIQKNASDEEVVKAAEKVEQLVKDKPALKKELGRITNTISNSGKLENYGTAKAQEYIKKWAKQYK